MHDSDWMIPRHLHAPTSDGSGLSDKSEAVHVDPEFQRVRSSRKQNLQPQPRGGAPEQHIDTVIARIDPAFPKPMWTLGDTARWVIERTPDSVNGLSINEKKLFEVLDEIHEALSGGEISVFAHTTSDPVPSELPAETWSVYELIVEELNGLIRIFPLNSNSTDGEQHLWNLRLKRDDVLRRWPSDSDKNATVQPTTTGAENQCRRWLTTLMNDVPNDPQPKSIIWSKALAKFPKLSKRGFDRAWDQAVRAANAEKWRAPGRRR
jgi:hypothetical protein